MFCFEFFGLVSTPENMFLPSWYPWNNKSGYKVIIIFLTNVIKNYTLVDTMCYMVLAYERFIGKLFSVK